VRVRPAALGGGMSPFQAAHLRILESRRLPVRTHEARVVDLRSRTGRANVVPVEVWRERRRRIAQLANQRNRITGRRWTERDIAKQIGISRTAVQEHVRALLNAGWKRKPV
jgi:hypothetical protein